MIKVSLIFTIKSYQNVKIWFLKNEMLTKNLSQSPGNNEGMIIEHLIIKIILLFYFYEIL